jgi:subtilisin-like proprotein convertase family protein
MARTVRRSPRTPAPRSSLTVVLALAAAIALSTACGGGGGGKASPGIRVSSTSLVTNESGTTASFEVNLLSEPSATVVLTVSSGDSTEGLVLVPGSAYPSSWDQLTFTTSNWQTPQVVQIVGQNDQVADGNVTYTVTVSVGYTSDTNYVTVPARTISVTNGDNETAALVISKRTLSTTEAGGTDSFTVSLSAQPVGTVTVPVATTDTSEGLVRGGSSPTTPAASLNLTFTTYNWNTPQTVTVHGQNDLVDDGNQTYDVTVGPPTGDAAYAALVAERVSVTNVDDDTAGVTVLPSATPIRTSEYGTTGTFTVQLNSQPVADVVIPVTSGDATEGLVSVAGQGPAASVSLTFTAASWNTPQTVTVQGQDDAVLGDNVAYAVTVGPATGADPVYPGLAAQAVQVLNTDNDLASFSIPEAAGGAPLVTSESGTSAQFTIVLNKTPATNVVIPVTVSDITEGLVKGGDSPGVLVQTLHVTFTPADWQTPQTITVVGQPDVMVDGNVTYAINAGPPTGDAEYVAAAPVASISVTNSDTNQAGYTVSPLSIYHTEGSTPTSFTVRLNTQPLQAVTIPVTSNDTTEGEVALLSGGPYGATASLTFDAANWSTPQSVYVRGVVDHIDDDTQTYTLTVGPTASLDSPYQGLIAKTVSATSYDSPTDVSAYVVTPLSGLVTTEAGGTATFSVVLATIPNGTVSVPVAVANGNPEVAISTGGGAQSSSLTLVFTASDWNTPQVVTVHGQDDALLDGAQPFTIACGPTYSGDPKYNNLAAVNVTGTNQDDEVGANQGASGAPLDVSMAMPFSGQVGTGYSYYVVTGLTGNVAVTLTNVTDDVSLLVDNDGNYNNGTLCSSSNVGPNASESCVATVPAGGAIYIRVSGAGTVRGAGYTLTVAQSYLYQSTDVPKAILDYATATSLVSVSGATTTITKVIVRLSLTHTYDGDLTLSVVSPGGTEVVLAARRGGSGDNYTNTVFDDAAAVSIASGTAPFTGTFRPDGLLSSLNGQNANGTWTLKVQDSASPDTGSLTSWSVEVY